MANNSKITWYILEDEEYIQDDEYYLGSFSPDSEIQLKVQVWNNRYGKNNVESIPNARLAVYFDSIEDSMLLEYCTVSINDNNLTKIPVMFGKGIIDIGLLSGNSNNGMDIIDNTYNFKNITISFKGFPTNLKNGIKNMFLDIELD
jgi:hypothetical protein